MSSCTYKFKFGDNKDQLCNKEGCSKHGPAPNYYHDLINLLEDECKLDITKIKNLTFVYLDHYRNFEYYFNNGECSQQRLKEVITIYLQLNGLYSEDNTCSYVTQFGKYKGKICNEINCKLHNTNIQYFNVFIDLLQNEDINTNNIIDINNLYNTFYDDIVRFVHYRDEDDIYNIIKKIKAGNHLFHTCPYVTQFGPYKDKVCGREHCKYHNAGYDTCVDLLESEDYKLEDINDIRALYDYVQEEFNNYNKTGDSDNFFETVDIYIKYKNEKDEKRNIFAAFQTKNIIQEIKSVIPVIPKTQ